MEVTDVSADWISVQVVTGALAKDTEPASRRLQSDADRLCGDAGAGSISGAAPPCCSVSVYTETF